jgi:hypothetical protein
VRVISINRSQKVTHGYNIRIMTTRFLLAVVAAVATASVSALSAVINLPNVASFNFVPSSSDGDIAIVAGHTIPGDGGGGTFILKTASSAPPDGGLIIECIVGGRWHRVTTTVDVRMFGAKGDGITNDRAAIQAAIDAASLGEYQSVIFGGGKRYYVSGSTSEASLTEGHWVPAPIYRGILNIGFHARRNVITINPSTEQLIIPSHGLNDGDVVVISSTGTIPTVTVRPLFPGIFYYAAKVASDTIKLYRDSLLTEQIDFVDSGTGTFRVEKSAGPKIALQLIGEGSTLYTDDESGSATVTNYGKNGANDFAPAPSIILVKTNLFSLTVRDLTLERAITGGRKSVPGNYQAAGGPTTPGSLSFGQKSYWDLPNTLNRVGVLLMPSSPDSVDSITFHNLTFIDCHTAVTATHVPAKNMRDYYGKLKILTMDGCRFVYPFGSNSLIASGVGTLFTQWIETAHITNCDFDGANGTIKDHHLNVPMDGFIFGNCDRLICTNNKIRHCGIEYIHPFPDGNLAFLGPSLRTITMPSGNNTVTLELDYPNSIPPWVTIGQRIYIGSGQPDSVGNRTSAGFMRIEAIDSAGPGRTRDKLTLTNMDGPFNAGVGESVTLQDCWISIPEFAGGSSALIANNEIDCSPSPGFAGPSPNSAHGGPAIRVNDVNTTITGNKILNTTFGIFLYETRSSENRMWGSLVSNNTIQLADAKKIVSGLNTSTDTLTVPGHTWNNGDWVVLSSSGSLPTVNGTAVVAGSLYFAKRLDNASIQLYRDAALSTSQLLDFTDQGSGVLSVTEFHESLGIVCTAQGTKIEGNSILAPNANHIVGIAADADYCNIVNNRIAAITRVPNGLPGSGIAVGTGVRDCHIDGNTTQRMQTAISNGGGEGNVYTIEGHHSVEDGQGPVLNGNAIYRNQEVKFLPPAEGWYRIVNQPYTPFAGELSIVSREPQGHMEAVVRMDYQAHSTRNLIQKSFNGDTDDLPVIDQVLLTGGTRPEVLVHVTRAATVAIILTFKTDMPGSGILNKPEHQEQGPAFADRNIKNISTSGGSTPTRAIITTLVPHGLSQGATILLLETPESLKLNGTYVISSIIDATTFTVPLAPGAQSTATATGSYFTSIGGSSFPIGLDKFLNFNRFNSLPSVTGVLSMTGTEMQTLAIDLNFNTNEREGILQNNVSSITIAIDGSLVANVASTGVEVAAGTDDQPGYSFEGDDDTGIFHPSDDTIAFATGGIERGRISNRGLSIGGGITIEKVSRGVAKANFGIIPALGTNEAAITVTGADVGDAIIINPAYPLTGLSARIVYNAYIPSPNTVIIRATNVTGTASAKDHRPVLNVTVISFGPQIP